MSMNLDLGLAETLPCDFDEVVRALDKAEALTADQYAVLQRAGRLVNAFHSNNLLRHQAAARNLELGVTA